MRGNAQIRGFVGRGASEFPGLCTFDRMYAIIHNQYKVSMSVQKIG